MLHDPTLVKILIGFTIFAIAMLWLVTDFKKKKK